MHCAYSLLDHNVVVSILIMEYSFLKTPARYSGHKTPPSEKQSAEQLILRLRNYLKKYPELKLVILNDYHGNYTLAQE